jgi:hypothetical protein
VDAPPEEERLGGALEEAEEVDLSELDPDLAGDADLSFATMFARYTLRLPCAAPLTGGHPGWLICQCMSAHSEQSSAPKHGALCGTHYADRPCVRSLEDPERAETPFVSSLDTELGGPNTPLGGSSGPVGGGSNTAESLNGLVGALPGLSASAGRSAAAAASSAFGSRLRPAGRPVGPADRLIFASACATGESNLGSYCPTAHASFNDHASVCCSILSACPSGEHCCLAATGTCRVRQSSRQTSSQRLRSSVVGASMPLCRRRSWARPL